MTDIKYTGFEMMLITAARQIENNDTLFGAIQWPFLVLQIANKLHAPDLNIVLETGTIHKSMPDKLPFSIIDPDIVQDSIYIGDSIDSLGFLQRGNIDKAFLSASIIDKYGNCNTSCIGDYDNPIYRLPGGGGATEVAALSRKLYWLLDEHTKRRLVPKTSFITDIGFINGGSSKIDCHYPKDAQVEAIITPLSILKFSDDTKEAYLHSIYPEVSIKEVKNNTGWPLEISDNMNIIDPPTKKELEVCRSVMREAISQYYILKPEWITYLEK
jgi:glutaconate CoA-transferase subunit B